jgi:fluoroacetyl-CoA thioesterase
MNLNTLLNIGETLVNEYIVKPEDTADFIGNKGVTTLSTPSMIAFMEDTAAHVVIHNIPENYRPVGTKINVEHIKPTSVNMKVTVKATLIAIEGRKLSFNVEAFNEKCKIGFGIYEQHVINLDNFLNNQYLT